MEAEARLIELLALKERELSLDLWRRIWSQIPRSLRHGRLTGTCKSWCQEIKSDPDLWKAVVVVTESKPSRQQPRRGLSPAASRDPRACARAAAQYCEEGALPLLATELEEIPNMEWVDFIVFEVDT